VIAARRPFDRSSDVRLLLWRLWFAPVAKSDPWNALPPSRGMMFIRIPPVPTSAGSALVWMLSSWIMPSFG